MVKIWLPSPSPTWIWWPKSDSIVKRAARLGIMILSPINKWPGFGLVQFQPKPGPCPPLFREKSKRGGRIEEDIEIREKERKNNYCNLPFNSIVVNNLSFSPDFPSRRFFYVNLCILHLIAHFVSSPPSFVFTSKRDLTVRL